MKKVLYILLSVFIIFACIVACDDNASKSKITPVTPIGPEEPEPVIVNNYITFKSSAPFSIVPSYEGSGLASWNVQLFYSTNTKDWIEFPRNAITTATSALTEGSHYLYFRGLENNVITMETPFALVATSDITCSGNIMNLLDYEQVEQEQDITMDDKCFSYMFNNWSYLTDVSELKLPALTLSDYCYFDMFSDSKITTAPELPATTLAKSCYGGMFKNCVNLTGTVELPATALAPKCYTDMFHECSSLAGCVIKATSFAADDNVGCCEEMFEGCTSLTSLTVSFTNWGTGASKDATDDWVLSVAPSGTFTCPGTLPLTTGSDYIPEGWTVVNGVSVTGVSLDTTSTTLSVGGNVTLNATVLPLNAQNKNVTWSSNNTSVATVSNGVVTGVGAGSATITVKTVDGSKTATCTVTVTQLITTGYASATNRSDVMWVQLWEDGPKWATFNVGATITSYADVTTTTTDTLGGLYSWGGSNERREGTTTDDKNTGISNLSGSSDTARNKWGSNWKMPTKEDFEALLTDTNCIWTWCDGNTTQTDNDCTLAGYKVCGKGDYAGNSIFLPLAGYFYNTAIDCLGITGGYWTSNYYLNNQAYWLYFDYTNSKYVNSNYRDRGFSVRAILVEN